MVNVPADTSAGWIEAGIAVITAILTYIITLVTLKQKVNDLEASVDRRHRDNAARLDKIENDVKRILWRVGARRPNDDDA